MEVTAEAQTRTALPMNKVEQHNTMTWNISSAFPGGPQHPGFEQHPHTRLILGLAPQQPSFPGNISLSRIPVPPPLCSLRILPPSPREGRALSLQMPDVPAQCSSSRWTLYHLLLLCSPHDLKRVLLIDNAVLRKVNGWQDPESSRGETGVPLSRGQ